MPAVTMYSIYLLGGCVFLPFCLLPAIALACPQCLRGRRAQARQAGLSRKVKEKSFSALCGSSPAGGTGGDLMYKRYRFSKKNICTTRILMAADIMYTGTQKGYPQGHGSGPKRLTNLTPHGILIHIIMSANLVVI